MVTTTLDQYSTYISNERNEINVFHETVVVRVYRIKCPIARCPEADPEGEVRETCMACVPPDTFPRHASEVEEQLLLVV